MQPPIPAFTEERRKELVKKSHVIAEDHRVALRSIRRDANRTIKKLVKDKLISEDKDRRANDEIQKLTDAGIQKLDQAAKGREKEIIEIRQGRRVFPIIFVRGVSVASRVLPAGCARSAHPGTWPGTAGSQ
ncbi:MAG: ribosome-recycling factor [Bryobacteraceae bacterium]